MSTIREEEGIAESKEIMDEMVTTCKRYGKIKTPTINLLSGLNQSTDDLVKRILGGEEKRHTRRRELNKYLTPSSGIDTSGTKGAYDNGDRIVLQYNMSEQRYKALIRAGFVQFLRNICEYINDAWDKYIEYDHTPDNPQTVEDLIVAIRDKVSNLVHHTRFIIYREYIDNGPLDCYEWFVDNVLCE